MPAIRLAKLPDRTPMKLAISVTPDLHRRLTDYAAFYEENYGEAVPIADLVPSMLECFISADRGFAQRQRSGR